MPRGAPGCALAVALALTAAGCFGGEDGDDRPGAPPAAREATPGFHVYVAELDGSKPRAVTSGSSLNGSAAWSPDGRKLALRTKTEVPGSSASSLDSSTAIRILTPEGRQLARFDAGPLFVGRIAWSPDSRRIAYVKRDDLRRASALRAFLVVGELDGERTRTLTERARSAAPDGPAWSPDGRRIAFASSVPGPARPGVPPALPEVSVIGADGRGERRLTRGLSEESEPHWLDRDRVIAVQLVIPPSPAPSRQMLVLRAAGGEPRTLIGALRYALPAVSPDGGRVAFAGVVGSADTKIHVYAARVGGEPKRLTDDIVTDRPTWSPDGREIAFAFRDRIDAVRADGSGRRTLVYLPGHPIRDPVWSPDGKRIAFSAGLPADPPARLPVAPPSGGN